MQPQPFYHSRRAATRARRWKFAVNIGLSRLIFEFEIPNQNVLQNGAIRGSFRDEGEVKLFGHWFRLKNSQVSRRSIREQKLQIIEWARRQEGAQERKPVEQPYGLHCRASRRTGVEWPLVLNRVHPKSPDCESCRSLACRISLRSQRSASSTPRRVADSARCQYCRLRKI